MISMLVAWADPFLLRGSEWLTSRDMDAYNRTGKFINYTHVIMCQLGAMFIALGLAGYATNPSVALFPFAIGSLWLGVALSPRSMPPRTTMIAIGVICVSALLAIPFAKNLPPTILLAWLTVALLPLIFVRNPYIWVWFMPAWIVHAVLCFWQWFVLHESRVSGITDNANSAAALLLIGCIYLLNGQSRVRWVILALLVAILFTGSRWTVGVSAVTLMALFLMKYVNWKYIAVGIIVAVLVTLIVDWTAIQSIFLRHSTLEAHLTGAGMATESAGLRFWPQGFTDNGIHSVPWRMMHETGVLSGVAWIVASGYGLFRYWRAKDSRWWMFLTVVLLSLMYYHAWLGPLAGFWWLLVRPSKLSVE